MNSSDFQNLQDLYFLGAKSEQRKNFQEMIDLINNDMIFWRRNFYPKDQSNFPYRHLTSQIGQDYYEKLIQELVKLLAELKMDLPFFSPRYIAHMTGDVSIPAILGYYAGLLYNSNNISPEASPVTLKYELEVGRMFAALFGFNPQLSFGHITSGGTVANYESIFYIKGARFLPLEFAVLIKKLNIKFPNFLKDDLWWLLNRPLDEIPEIVSEMKSFSQLQSVDLFGQLENFKLCNLGDFEFWNLVRDVFQAKVQSPVMIVPSTAHYSWSKASQLFGIGRLNCIKIKINKHLVMSISDYENQLESCLINKIPVMQSVAVLGTTEFGTFDQLPEIVDIIKKYKQKGLYTPLHLDAAYGGYMTTMFKTGEKHSDVSECAKRDYSEIHRIFSSTEFADSITIDPHKLGHVPYGAGVYVCKHGFLKDYISEKAPYCLSSKDETQDENFPLGKYILEGSKPGASAASVYFSHKIIPLNADGFGGLLYSLCEIAKKFHQLVLETNKLDGEVKLMPIIHPQSNLYCFYVWPRKIDKLSKINEFNASLMENFFPKQSSHIQDFSYFVSKTTLNLESMTNDDKYDFVHQLEVDTDELKLFRLVFLNRAFENVNQNSKSYMQDFIDKLLLEANKI